MTPAEAAKLLELPADATPEQLEARVLDLRRKLEDKVAKAPTPGLQAKYRETLVLVTTAFETLTLAGDSDSLPMLRRASVTAAPTAPAQAPTEVAPVAVPATSPAPAVSSGPRRRVWRRVRIGALAVVLGLAAIVWWYTSTERGTRTLERFFERMTNNIPSDELGWANLSRAELRQVVQDEWADAMKIATTCEAEAESLMKEYRLKPNQPARWQAETWAKAQARLQSARAIRMALAPGSSLHTAKAEVEALIAAGIDGASKEERDSFGALVSDLAHLHNLRYAYLEPDVPPDPLTSFQLTSNPEGLTWTVESRYDGNKVLLISGKTPVDDELFLGFGKGTVRLQCPGKRDVVFKDVNLGSSQSSRDRFTETVDFTNRP